ncbi:MAG TPA: VOC family protein [Flavisolibacter sp.]|jgi:catechol 2,3-dioxygenase-like lactoylglutathione lyase family enzyme
MNQRLAHVTIVVRDYDEALEFYTRKLFFTIIEDTRLTEEKRWILIAPQGNRDCFILLAKAANDRQAASVGNQTGGRVAFFLHTDDFWRDLEVLKQNKVKFVREPQEQEYGTVAVFEDLYGNLWDLVEPKIRK